MPKKKAHSNSAAKAQPIATTPNPAPIPNKPPLTTKNIELIKAEWEKFKTKINDVVMKHYQNQKLSEPLDTQTILQLLQDNQLQDLKNIFNEIIDYLKLTQKISEAGQAFDSPDPELKEQAILKLSRAKKAEKFKNLQNRAYFLETFILIVRDEKTSYCIEKLNDLSKNDYKTHAICFNNLGTLYIRQKRFGEAKNALETAIKLDSKNHNICFNMANLVLITQGKNASLPYFLKAREFDKNKQLDLNLDKPRYIPLDYRTIADQESRSGFYFKEEIFQLCRQFAKLLDEYLSAKHDEPPTEKETDLPTQTTPTTATAAAASAASSITLSTTATTAADTTNQKQENKTTTTSVAANPIAPPAVPITPIAVADNSNDRKWSDIAKGPTNPMLSSSTEFPEALGKPRAKPETPTWPISKSTKEDPATTTATAASDSKKLPTVPEVRVRDDVNKQPKWLALERKRDNPSVTATTVTAAAAVEPAETPIVPVVQTEPVKSNKPKWSAVVKGNSDPNPARETATKDPIEFPALPGERVRKDINKIPKWSALERKNNTCSVTLTAPVAKNPIKHPAPITVVNNNKERKWSDIARKIAAPSVPNSTEFPKTLGKPHAKTEPPKWHGEQISRRYKKDEKSATKPADANAQAAMSGMEQLQLRRKLIILENSFIFNARECRGDFDKFLAIYNKYKSLLNENSSNQYRSFNIRAHLGFILVALYTDKITDVAKSIDKLTHYNYPYASYLKNVYGYLISKQTAENFRLVIAAIKILFSQLFYNANKTGEPTIIISNDLDRAKKLLVLAKDYQNGKTAEKILGDLDIVLNANPAKTVTEVRVEYKM